MARTSIGASLVQQGYIKIGQLQSAKQLQQRHGGRLGEILIGMGALTEDQFQRFLANRYQFGYFDSDQLLTLNIKDDLLDVFSYEKALNQLALPVKKGSNGGVLEVITLAPLSDEVVDSLLQLTQQKKIQYHLATRHNLLQAIRYHYGQFLRRTADNEPFPGLSEDDALELSSEGLQKKKKSSHSLIALRREGFCPSCGFPYDPGSAFCPKCGQALNKEGDPLLGQILENKFQLVKQIGEGGMGLIYEGVQLDTNQPVALKLLRNQFKVDEQAVQRFSNEVEILRRLDHPNILQVHEFVYEERTGFVLVMELLEGCNLEEYIDAHQEVLSNEQLAMIFSKVCDGMEHAHQMGIIHRDLKPENIFLVGGPSHIEEIKLLDFGVAKMTESATQGLTQAGIILGTPRYFSPEQAMSRPIDYRSDIYSLGVIFFEILTRTELFQAENPYEYLMRHVYTAPTPITVARPDLTFPQGLESFLLKSLDKNPDNRPTSMRAFKNILLSIFDDGSEFFKEIITIPSSHQSSEFDSPPTLLDAQEQQPNTPSPISSSYADNAAAKSLSTQQYTPDYDLDDDDSPTRLDFFLQEQEDFSSELTDDQFDDEDDSPTMLDMWAEPKASAAASTPSIEPPPPTALDPFIGTPEDLSDPPPQSSAPKPMLTAEEVEERLERLKKQVPTSRPPASNPPPIRNTPPSRATGSYARPASGSSGSSIPNLSAVKAIPTHRSDPSLPKITGIPVVEAVKEPPVPVTSVPVGETLKEPPVPMGSQFEQANRVALQPSPDRSPLLTRAIGTESTKKPNNARPVHLPPQPPPSARSINKPQIRTALKSPLDAPQPKNNTVLWIVLLLILLLLSGAGFYFYTNKQPKAQEKESLHTPLNTRYAERPKPSPPHNPSTC